jgi:hypothetical protein
MSALRCRFSSGVAVRGLSGAMRGGGGGHRAHGSYSHAWACVAKQNADRNKIMVFEVTMPVYLLLAAQFNPAERFVTKK